MKEYSMVSQLTLRERKPHTETKREITCLRFNGQKLSLDSQEIIRKSLKRLCHGRGQLHENSVSEVEESVL